MPMIKGFRIRTYTYVHSPNAEPQRMLARAACANLFTHVLTGFY